MLVEFRDPGFLTCTDSILLSLLDPGRRQSVKRHAISIKRAILKKHVAVGKQKVK
jgi:hypothetical protein